MLHGADVVATEEGRRRRVHLGRGLGRHRRLPRQVRWFSLRDANTASGQLENGYGLLHDDYTPKPAFAAYQQTIATEGA